MAVFRHRYYTLGVLILVALFNYIDRQSLAILQVPIGRDLHLSDSQLGALTGLSFALLYSTLALPIARLADRQRRSFVIAGALGVWSAMTAATGLANGFAMLVFLRMGVALGEAGCVPATHALIADSFLPRQRATAVSIWSLSFPAGLMLGFLSGGWLNDWLGWRTAFAVLGLAGVALVPLVALLPEPQRGATDPVSVGEDAPLPLMAALQHLWALRTFRHATWGGALVCYALYATLNWSAPFYNRVFHIPTSELGSYLALQAGLGGGLGVYLGGTLADRLGRVDSRWYMWVPAFAAAAAVPFMLAQYFIDDAWLSLLLGCVPAILFNSFVPPLVATAQSLVPASLRAFTSAILVLVVNIIGLGLGPYLTGWLSDALMAQGLGEHSLRYAVPTAAIMALWGSAHLLRAASSLPDELRAKAAARDAAERGTLALADAGTAS